MYPSTPGSKATDTSSSAARAIASRAGVMHDRVLEVMCAELWDWTADEMAALLGESVLAIRPRFSELVAQGAITDSGHRRKNKSGRSAIAWIATRWRN